MTTTRLFVDHPSEINACRGRHGHIRPEPRLAERAPETRDAMTLRLLAQCEALELALTEGTVGIDAKSDWLKTLNGDELDALHRWDAAVDTAIVNLGNRKEAHRG